MLKCPTKCILMFQNLASSCYLVYISGRGGRISADSCPETLFLATPDKSSCREQHKIECEPCTYRCNRWRNCVYLALRNKVVQMTLQQVKECYHPCLKASGFRYFNQFKARMSYTFGVQLKSPHKTTGASSQSLDTAWALSKSVLTYAAEINR